MIRPFKFARVPSIIFRPGSLSELPGIASGFGKKVILVTGGRSFVSSEAAGILLNSLAKEGIKAEIVSVNGEPSPEMIDEAAQKYRNYGADLVVAIGGGSVMDAGKAISAMLTVEGSVTGFLEDVGTMQHPGTKIPFIAVPTTSGTGSEATRNAVLSRVGEGGFKKSLRHDNFVPEIALVDPGLTLGCPPEITAAAGMDCFTQLTEAFLSAKSNDYTDALAIQGLKAVKGSLLKSYTDGDIESRTGMSFAALTSGICLANAGLGTVHGFASSIGGSFNIPHGVICGTLMARVNEVNVRKLRETGTDARTLKKYSLLGKIFLETEKTDDYLIDGFINFLIGLTDRLRLPGLKSLGFDANQSERICSETDNKNNPVKLVREDLMEIVSSRNY